MERGIESMCSAWGREGRTKERRGGSRSYIPTHDCWIVQAEWQNEPSTRAAVWAIHARRRRSGEDNQAQCEPRWPRLTDRLHTNIAGLRRGVPFALAPLSERAIKNLETLRWQAQQGVEDPRDPTINRRHHCGTTVPQTVPFPMGKE